jgi:hypothetical protein
VFRADVLLLERTVSLGINEAYADLKALLLRKGCRIVAEEPPTFISVKQGSLWGISPRTAKKMVRYRLSPVDSGTRTTVSSSLASDWKNLTIIGSALAVLLMALCWWITADLEAFMITQEPSYWSWIVMVNSHIDFQTGQMLVSLTGMLTVFLAIITALEAVIAVYAHFRINAFAKENLKALS